MKKLSLIFAFVLVFIAFPGCSGGSGGDVDMSAGDAAAKLLEAVAFRDNLVRVADDVAENYYKFGDDVAEYAVYLSGNGATAEEIAVLKTDAGGDAETLRPLLEKRIAAQKIRYEDYVPGELKKLGDPVIISRGNMIVMVLADDAPQAEDAVNELFK